MRRAVRAAGRNQTGACALQGSPEFVTDLIAGRITLSFIVGSSIIGQIKAGQLAVLATTGAKRSSVLPDVPTMAEAGIPGFDY